MARLQLYTRHIPDPPKGQHEGRWQGIGAFAPSRLSNKLGESASQCLNLLVMRLLPRDYSSHNHKQCFIKGGYIWGGQPDKGPGKQF
jgi:hypothetical protein